MITKFSHTTLFVIDQDRAYDFYVSKLGFNVTTDATLPNGFRWLTVSPPDQPGLEIALLTPLSGGMQYDDEAKAAFRVLLEKNALGAGVMHTPVCLGFAHNLRQSVVPRFSSVTYEELKNAGVVFKSEPKEQFYGIEAVVTDSVGNWFSMTQPAPRP